MKKSLLRFLFPLVIFIGFFIFSKPEIAKAVDLPDLTIDSVTFDLNDGYSKPVVKNQGKVAVGVGFSITQTWLRTDGSVTGQSVQLSYAIGGRRGEAAIVPGATRALKTTMQTITSAWFPPSDAAKVRLVIDPSNGIAESNEDNNIREVNLFPDIGIESVSFDSQNSPKVIIKSFGPASAIFKSTASGVWIRCYDSQLQGIPKSVNGNCDAKKVLSSFKDFLIAGESVEIPFSLPVGVPKVKFDVALFDSAGNSVVEKDWPNQNTMGPNNRTEKIDVPKANADNLVYPIKELGNCESKEACKAYCEKPENADACSAFGLSTGLLTEEEAEAAKEVSEISEMNTGPGNCTTKESCAKFCDDPANISACLNYAEKNNWMSKDDLAKAKKVANVLATEGTQTPGKCDTPDKCKTYCDDSAHAVECVAFGKSAGLISAKEAAEAEKVAPLMQRGETPGGKKTRKELEEYCGSHRDECDAFFDQAGVKKGDEEKLEAKRLDGEGPKGGPEEGSKETPPSIFKSESGGPGGCKTKAECDAYCDSHPGECDEQVKQAGGEVKEIKVTCSTREECQKICDNPTPENKEACRNVVIKEEPPESKGPTVGGESDEQIKENIRKIRENIQEMPPQSHECLKEKLGVESYEKIMRGEIPSVPLTPEISQACFAQGVQKQGEEAAQKPEGQEARDAEAQRTQNLAPTIVQSIKGVQGVFTSLLDIVSGWFRK